jgi:hypothetical protein
MTGTEFSAFLAAHDLTEVRAASLFDVDRATVQRWKIRKHVPGPVALCCRILTAKLIKRVLFS